MAALLSGWALARLGEEVRGPLQAVTASRAMRWQATQHNSAGCGCSSTANGKPPYSGSYSHDTDEEAACVHVSVGANMKEKNRCYFGLQAHAARK